jgi:hypothetical protein
VELGGQAEPGQQLRCPVCRTTFTPRAEVISFKDEPVGKPKAAARTARPRAAARPATAAPPATARPPARPVVVDDDDKDDATPYGVVRESEEEQRLANKNKPTFQDPRDKFKRSARGPASALLVLPTNLLVAEGALTSIVGLAVIVIGLWPIVFTDAPPSDEEYAEALTWIFGGLVLFVWGALVCLGASKMQNLESYAWGIVGAVLGIFPLLAGIFALVALRDPRVIAGFEEIEGAIEDEEEVPETEEDEEEEEEEEDE